MSQPKLTLESNKRVYLDRREMDKLHDDLVRRKVSFIDGGSTIFVISTKIKYVDLDDTFVWPDLGGDPQFMTPGEIARLEVKRYLGDNFSLDVRKADLPLLDISPPQYYDARVIEGPLVQVDLKGAYHQIYSPLSLDIAYPRGQGDLLLYSVAKALEPNKLARNALMGLVRNRTLTRFTKGEYKEVQFRNKIFNPALWATVQDVLHSIAAYAIDCGAFYVATDGFIFDNTWAAKEFMEWLTEHKIKFTHIAGYGYVRGWAEYKVGEKQTKFSGRKAFELDNIQKGDRWQWLNWWMTVRNLK